MSIVYLNNEFLPRDQAKISVLDRGFVLGDGVYEVIPAFHGRLFRLDEHLARLQASLDAIHIENPLPRQQWEAILNELLARNGGGELSVYLQISRGVAPRDHAFPKNTPPTVFIMANPIPEPDPAVLSNGVSAITLEDIRWQFCNIKATSLLSNVLLRQEAVSRGSAEAILLRNGIVTEGAASNVFIVQQKQLKTPPKSGYILAGITRDLIVELAAQHGIACSERDFSAQALREADEIWVTSSTKEIVPVTRLDDKPVGNGKPGPMWRQMVTHYQTFKKDLGRS